jgi:hypothetical protein
MQIGVGGGPSGTAGDEYDALRRHRSDPALGPHDPTAAVELAALVLIKDKGAPTGQPIDAYWAYARAYNGSGPVAAAYRNAWDGKTLQTMAKNSPLRATGAHIGIVGHITKHELLRHITATWREAPGSFFCGRGRSTTCGSCKGMNHAQRAASVTLAAVLAAEGNVRVAMQPLGFRFDEDAVLLDGTAHRTDCPLLPVPLPRDAVRLCAGEILRAERCPRACNCAARFETLLSFQLVAATSSNPPATL